MKRTLMLALTATFLVGCSFAKKMSATEEAVKAGRVEGLSLSNDSHIIFTTWSSVLTVCPGVQPSLTRKNVLRPGDPTEIVIAGTLPANCHLVARYFQAPKCTNREADYENDYESRFHAELLALTSCLTRAALLTSDMKRDRHRGVE